MSYRTPICSVLAAGLMLSTGAARAQTFSSGALDQPIPDGGSIASELVVQGGPAQIGTVRVRVSISHSWDADLDIVLVPPGQLEYVHLASDLGGSGDGFVATTFDTGGPRSVREAGAPFTGVFRPEGGEVIWTGGTPLPSIALAGLHALAGRGADGIWQLRIADDQPGETGVLRDWALLFAGPGVPRDPAASLRLSRDSVSPGSILIAELRVTPGQFPASTGVVAMLDGGAIGAGVVPMLDDGVEPDVAPGDGVFTAELGVGAGTPPGGYELGWTVQDAQLRSIAGAAGVTVLPVPAANDVCEAAEELTGPLPMIATPRGIAGNAELCERELACAAGGSSNAARSVWYRFVCPQSGDYIISASPARTPGCTVSDTVLSVYVASDGTCANLSPLACDDDSGQGFSAELSVPLVAGAVYYVQLAEWAPGAAAGGELSVWIDRVVPVGACCTPQGCQLVAAEECMFLGGTYLGDGVACYPGSGPVLGPDAAVFEDIRVSGERLMLGDDDATTLAIGFEFEFLGAAFTACGVGSNGLITFGDLSVAYANDSIPSSQVPNNAVYALWDDLDPGAGGGITTELRGVPGVDLRRIVQWTQVPQYGRTDANTFQIVLHESGEIAIVYETVSTFADTDATVGIEGVGGEFGLAREASSIVAGLGLVFAESPGVSSCGDCAWRIAGCGADYTGDDAIDGDDVIAFFADWDGGIACADVDQSDSVDGDDVIAFFIDWDAGGC